MAGEGEEKVALTPEQEKTAREEITKELWGDGKPAVQDEPEENPEEGLQDADEKGTAEEPDPWAGINPAPRQEFESLKAKATEFDTVSERLKQAERRIGSITNELSQAKKASEEATKAKEDAPTKEQIDAAAKSKEEWEQLKEDYPEWADAIDKRLTAQREEIKKELGITGTLKQEIEALKGAGASDEKIQEIKVEFSKQLVSLAHPKWETKVKSKEFTDWIGTQADDVKTKCTSWNASDAIEVLDMFDGRENGGRKQKTADEIARGRRERLLRAETPSAGRVRRPSKQEDDMSDEEYRRKLARDLWTT